MRKIPYLMYLPKTPDGKHQPCIKAGREVVHYIENLGDFHRVLGYTSETAKTGILPDEFLWQKYFSDAAESGRACFQAHLVEYLTSHCAAFRSQYGGQYENTSMRSVRAEAEIG